MWPAMPARCEVVVSSLAVIPTHFRRRAHDTPAGGGLKPLTGERPDEVRAVLPFARSVVFF